MYQASKIVEAHNNLCAPDGSLESILRDLQSLPSEEGLLPKEGMIHAGSGLSCGDKLLSGTSSAQTSESLFGQMLTSVSLNCAPLFPDAIPNCLPETTMMTFMEPLSQNQQLPPQLPPQQILTAMPTHIPRGSLDSSEEDPNSPGGIGDGQGLAKRQRRLQEKNRTAQKRYRQRQKEKMHGFEKQVEDLSEQVTALMREKANLATRNSLLERVVALKEEQQQQLKTGLQHEGACTGASAELLLGRAVAALHNVVRPREPPVTEQETRHWDHMCIFRLYNDYANELLHAMLLWDSEDQKCPSYLRILALVRAHQQAVLQLTTMEPRMVSRVCCELKRRLPEDRSTWAKCVQAMQLSDAQRQHLLDMRSALFAQMEVIVQQRRRIIADLEASIPSIKTSFSGARTRHQFFEQAMNASDGLKESLDLEHREVSKLVAAFHGSNLLTEIQLARCTVEAHPYMVDIFGITDAVAAEEGAESQGSFMASLMADMEHGGSLMPSDSAFRIASMATQQQHQQQGQEWSSNAPGPPSPPAAAF